MPDITIDNGQRKLYYAIQQPASPDPSRPTILFIHGLACSSSVWMPIMPSIAAAGYTCIALDTHGMGRSPYAGVSGHEQTTQDIAEAMQVLKLSPANTVLCTHSIAGIYGSNLATRYPLAAALFVAPWWPNESDATTRAALWQSLMDLIQTKGTEGFEEYIKLMVTTSLGPNATDLMRALIADMALNTSFDGMMGAFQTCFDATPENIADCAQISCPILAICGKSDRPTYVDICNTLIDSVRTDKSKKKLEFMDDVGHWAMLEAPEELTKLILDFLKTLY